MTWFEEPVSSDDLAGLRLLRDRAAGRHGDRRRRVRLRPLVLPPHAGGAERSTCCRPTPRAAAASPASCAPRRCARPSDCRSRPTARPSCTRTCAARRARPPPRVLPRPRPHRADALRRRARASRRALRPDATRPASASSRAGPSSSATRCGSSKPFEYVPRRVGAEPRGYDAADRGAYAYPGARPFGQADRLPSLRGAAAGLVRAFPSRRRERWRRIRAPSTARCASTRAAARSTRPTPRTTARCRSASWSRATVDDVIATVAVCRQHGAPVLARGGGTSLAGQCCNVAVVIDFSKYLQPDPRDRPGAALRPRRARRRPRRPARTRPSAHGLTFGPDPVTHTRCTLGGMIGNNSCGVALGHGRARPRDNVEELDVLTYDGLRLRVGATAEDGAGGASSRRAAGAGEIYARAARPARPLRRPRSAQRFPKIPRRVSGYNLRRAAARERLQRGAGAGRHRGHLRHRPARRGCAWSTARRRARCSCSATRTSTTAADHVPEVLAATARSACEGIDDRLDRGHEDEAAPPASDRALLPEGGGWLLVEFGGETQGGGGRARRARLMDALEPAAPARRR